jgi:sulfur relay (sulfurtransferase) DsrC/TusE family protein
MKVSKLIHDLEKELTDIRQANLRLSKANEVFRQENIDLRKNQDHDELNRSITNLRIENDAFITEGVTLRNENEGYLKEIKKLKKENVRLVAQLENDEHNVGHLDEKMKRLDYLEKVFASNRYVFTDIPNTPENLKMVKMMKKYVNKRRYNLRWRGQYLVEGENWKQYQYGQPLSKSKCIRVYIDSLTHAIDTVEGFNEEEVGVILDGLYKAQDQSEEFITSFEVEGEENAEIDEEKRIVGVTKQLINYFRSMRLHLQNSASTPIKDLVNIVIPKGDKKCHTQ